MSFYVVELALKFFSRKIFLEYLGTEILGLNTTAVNILGFLNLAELGIGAAVGFTLYKPLYDKNISEINEIISLQGWMYRKVAYCVIAGSVILMGFFPLIFSKIELPLWYAYASFGVLLFSSLLGYFVNYKQIILSADQKDYKIQYSYRASMLAKVVFQMIAITTFGNGYVWWLILEFVFAIVASAILNRVIRKSYPYLKADISRGKELSLKYSGILTKVKQLFFHKIGTFVLSQSSSIIIYAYASLTLVALYGNYMLIVTGVTLLINAVFNSITAGVGNLLAEGDRSKTLAVFEELFSIRFWFACVICYSVYILSHGFITLWIGPEYILDNTVLALMVATLYIQLTRSTVDTFISATGSYGDIWAPVVEAVLNIGLSVLLGYFWGLNGILTGVLISLVVVILFWKPFYLFQSGLRQPFRIYVFMYVRHILVLFSVCIVYAVVAGFIVPVSTVSWSGFIATALLHVAIFSVVFFAGMLVLPGMRDFIHRCKTIKQMR